MGGLGGVQTAFIIVPSIIVRFLAIFGKNFSKIYVLETISVEILFYFLKKNYVILRWIFFFSSFWLFFRNWNFLNLIFFSFTIFFLLIFEIENLFKKVLFQQASVILVNNEFNNS